MSSLTTRVARRLLALSAASLLACQAETRLAPDGADTPPPDLARYAFYLDIDVANGTVRVVSPLPAPSRSSGWLAYSLAGSEIVGMTTSNFFRSAIGQFVANKRTITFDLTLSNKLSVTDLVTPTFPLPPPGVQGIIAFPYTVAAYGVSGGKALPDTSWNGTGAPGGGAPVNFFNDLGVCGTAATSDCYRWEAFPTPLNPGQSTPAQKVGFTVDKKVTNVGVYVVVAADLVDHTPPPQPGLGALSGTVTSASMGLLGGVSVALAPGGQSAVTDGVGRYLFTGLPVGPFTATASGLPSGCTATASVSGTIVSGGLATANFDVTCQPTTGSISGMATSPELGALASATVQLLQAGATTPVSQTTTNAAGAFTFSSVAPGSYVVQLVGLTPPCPSTAGPVAVTVTAGNTSNPVFLVPCVATSSGTLFGQVFSSPFGPYVFQFSISSSGGGPPVLVYSDPVTESFGPITIAAGQVTVTLIGFPTNCTPPFPQTAPLAAGAVFTVRFLVTCGAVGTTGTINGVASSPEVGPLAGVTAQLLQSGATTPVSQTTTDAAGGFHFAAVAPGSYTVQLVGLAPPCPATGGPVSVTVTAGATSTANFSVSCPVMPTAIITGTVGSPTLGALNGVTVTATVTGAGTTHLTQTSGAGDFSFDSSILPPGMRFANVILTLTAGLPPGCSTPLAVLATVDASAAAPVAVPISVNCTPPATTGSISGTVTWLGGALSEPLSITGPGGPPITLMPDPLSGAYGPVSVALGQATVALTAVPAGCTDPGAQTVSVAAGATVTVDFGVVCPNSNIIGRIISPTLGPLGGVTVAVTINGVDNGSVVSDAGGNFAGLFFWTGLGSATVDLTVTGGLPQGCTTGGLSLTVAKGVTGFGHISVAC